VAKDADFKHVIFTRPASPRRNAPGRLRPSRASSTTGRWNRGRETGGRRRERTVGVHAGCECADQPARGRSRASLAGSAEPQEGKLLVSTDLAPAAGRDGAAHGALAFKRHVVQVGVRRAAVSLADVHLRRLVLPARAWRSTAGAGTRSSPRGCAPVNDPLRVSVQDRELVVSIEQPNGGHRLSGGRVENGKWTHVAVVKKFTELTLYVNGRPVGSATVPASFQRGHRTSASAAIPITPARRFSPARWPK